MSADPILPQPQPTSESTPPDPTALLSLDPAEAARLFEQQIIKFKQRKNWPAVQGFKQLAAALGIKLDRLRIRRAVLRAAMIGNAPHRAARHRRRAEALGRAEHFSAEEWLALLEFYRYRCCFCGRDTVKLEVDHVVALAQGGSNRIENIQPLCADCHVFFGLIDRQEDHRCCVPDWFEPR